MVRLFGSQLIIGAPPSGLVRVVDIEDASHHVRDTRGFRGDLRLVRAIADADPYRGPR